MMRWSASSGASSVLRIERRRSPAVAMKMVVMAWLQGTRRRVRRGRASRIQGGARGLTGWVWGCWWLRWCSSAVSVRPGMSEGERQRRERARGEREGLGGAWRVQGVGGVKQAGWRWPARGQQAASTRPCPSVQGGRRQGAAVVGWAASYSTGPISGRQVSFCQVSPSLSSYFSFCFLFILLCFDLVIKLKHFCCF